MCSGIDGLGSKLNSIIGVDEPANGGHAPWLPCSFPSHSEISGDPNHARVLSQLPSCPGQLCLPLPVLRIPCCHLVGPLAPSSPVAFSIAEALTVLRVPREASNLNMNHSRTTTCKLTIIHVNPTPPIQLDEQPPSLHRRHVGSGAHSRNAHGRLESQGTGKGENTRMSFASASFSPPGSSSGPGLRSGSPTHGHGHTCIGILLHRGHVSPRSSSSHSLSSPVVRSPHTPLRLDGSLDHSRQHPGRVAIQMTLSFLLWIVRKSEVRALFKSPQPGGTVTVLAFLSRTLLSKSVPEYPVTDESVFETDAKP